MAKLTAKTIKELIQKHNLGGLYILVRRGDDVDRLGANISCKNRSRNPYLFYEELTQPLQDEIEYYLGNNYLEFGKDFSMHPDILGHFGFKVDGWPKLRQLLKALGIEYVFNLDIKDEKFGALTPRGRKILGV